MRGVLAPTALLLSIVATVSPATAQGSWPLPVEDPVLAGLIDEALASNPDIAAFDEEAAAASNRPAQARSLADPMLSAGYVNDGWSPTLGTEPMTTLGFMASQDLPYPGKRALRGDIEARVSDQVRQRPERARLSITGAVKRAYYGLLLSRELLELIRDQETLWRQIEGITRARYAVGLGAQQDVLRAQVEVTRIDQLRTEQEAQREVRLAELNRLVARPSAASLETTTRLALRPAEAEFERLSEWAAGVSPEVAAADLGVEEASLRLALARKEFKPDFTVQGGYMNRGDLDPMWQLGIGVSVPLYRKRLNAGVAEAEASIRAREQAAEAIRLQLRFRTQERLAKLEAIERVAMLYGDGIVPQDRMSVAAAIANYQTGQIPFIAVLEALATYYDDRSTYLGLLAEHEGILADLEEASLESDAPMRGGGGMAVAAGGGPATAGSASGAASMDASGGMLNR